jgi:hypothetical protein
MRTALPSTSGWRNLRNWCNRISARVARRLFGRPLPAILLAVVVFGLRQKHRWEILVSPLDIRYLYVCGKSDTVANPTQGWEPREIHVTRLAVTPVVTTGIAVVAPFVLRLLTTLLPTGGRSRFLQLADSSVDGGRARTTASSSVGSVSVRVLSGVCHRVRAWTPPQRV